MQPINLNLFDHSLKDQPTRTDNTEMRISFTPAGEQVLDTGLHCLAVLVGVWHRDAVLESAFLGDGGIELRGMRL